MHIAILGAGRLGRSLRELLPLTGHECTLVGRGGSIPTCDVIWLTVPDLALSTVTANLPPAPVALHASGATDLSVFGDRAGVGSLHPLMTFPGPEHGLPNLSGVPAAIAGDPGGLEVARALAIDLGLDAFEVPGDRRLYHAAAVLAGNGATVLLGEACRALHAAGVPVERCAALLAPLVQRSIDHAVPSPIHALTGPIARGEDQVISAHVQALRESGLSDVAELHDMLARTARRARRRSRDES